MAGVAELADAPDSKFLFWHFQRVTLRFRKSDETIEFIDEKPPPTRQPHVPIQPVLLSQLLSQFPTLLKAGFMIGLRVFLHTLAPEVPQNDYHESRWAMLWQGRGSILVQTVRLEA